MNYSDFVQIPNFLNSILFIMEGRDSMDVTVERIMLLLKEKNIEQKDLAEHLGTNKQTITDWKNGKTKSYQKCIDKIAEFFNVSVDFLLGRTDSPNGTYSINGNNNVQVNGHNGDHSPLTVNSTLQLDEMERNLIEAFRALDFPEKIETVSGLMKQAQKKSPSEDGKKE